jgi:anti-sigma regulatory factor (Ser/Thr protein kinase)
VQVLQVQLEIGPDPAEVGRARRWARSRLTGSGTAQDEGTADALVLIISELVTNAVVHTGCPAVLRMLFGLGAADADTVRVEVTDGCATPPAPRHAGGDDTGGRGLELVEGLADRWGWQPEGAGKRIWCEVDRGTRCGEAAPRVAAAVVVPGPEAAPAPAAASTDRPAKQPRPAPGTAPAPCALPWPA